MSLSDEATIRFQLTTDLGALNVISIYRSNEDATEWEELTVEQHDNGMVSAQTRRGGYFVATQTLNGGVVAGKYELSNIFQSTRDEKIIRNLSIYSFYCLAAFTSHC